MKVKELMLHTHLFGEQKTTLHDQSTLNDFVTYDRCCFNLGAPETERLLKLTVQTFRVSDKGIEIFAK